MNPKTRLQSDYDEKSDTLLLYSATEKPADSVILGDLIVEYSKDGKLVSLEFLNPTETILAL